MSSLAELTNAYPQQDNTLPVEGPYRGPNLGPLQAPADAPIGNTAAVVPDTNAVVQPNPNSVGSSGSQIIDKLLGLGGQERYQLWPEKVVRDALAAPHDAMSGATPQYEVDPTTGDVHTSPQMIAGAQAVSALAGSGGLAGVEKGAGEVLGSAPFLRPALKYGDKIYKAPMGGQHLDALPAHLQDTFQQQAMNGEDISNFNFGFMNHKGQFLDREKALDYGIKEGLIDPSAGQYGALTSTLLADSSKPGTAIEAMAKTGDAKLPQGYYDKIPLDMRLSRSGTEPSHPGFRFEVYDPTTGKTMRKDIMTSSGATKTLDNLDNKYGGYKYRKRMIKASNLTDNESKFLKDNNINLEDNTPKYKLVPVDHNPFESKK
jgi:hypothetical protein